MSAVGLADLVCADEPDARRIYSTFDILRKITPHSNSFCPRLCCLAIRPCELKQASLGLRGLKMAIDGHFFGGRY